ncbi:phenol degradation protein meta [Pectobacterium actinidiae]|uniref:Phenol degradation protein meta n=1 Tax=Pectobacterium actinidiae TaxID=1507808 RepID=A0A1V2R1R3_9GAMM|nr:transporter [Pectobacterium actinidiae]ONK02721.1 phenol degradation protein meta [Pectobacterium actinidiae]ONK04307.1 phenol degradation protein meta [Pectobacterium actinidiae]
MKKIYGSTGFLFAASLCVPAHALEFSPGDYEMLPADKNLALAYFQYAHSDAFFSQDKKVAGDYRLRTEATLLRFIHGFRPTEDISIEPQMIIPFAKADAMGDASSLGNASGMGDIVLGVPFKFRVNNSGADILALAPFIYAPTGAYDNEQAINIGENRWRYLLQGVWIHHFSDSWAFDTGVDVSWTTANGEFGANKTTLKQSPRYEYQAYLRYNLTPATQFGVGGGWITGAESRINGVSQDDRLDSTYVRLSASHFITPGVQLQLSGGRDLSVEQGFKQDTNLSLRLGFLF